MSSTLELTPLGLRKRIWSAVVTQHDKGVPQIEVLHLDKQVDTVKLEETDDKKKWALVVTIPDDAITDGIQTFSIVDTLASESIGHFTLIAGDALGEDIRAEVGLLRAELDMLKRAFRRHCVETS